MNNGDSFRMGVMAVGRVKDGWMVTNDGYTRRNLDLHSNTN